MGRVDDLIVINSHKICPEDVEEKIVSLSGVEACAIAPISVHDSTFLGCLYVGERSIYSAMFLKCFLPYEIPKIFFRCAELPYNHNGKLLRSVVKEILEKKVLLQRE